MLRRHCALTLCLSVSWMYDDAEHCIPARPILQLSHLESSTHCTKVFGGIPPPVSSSLFRYGIYKHSDKDESQFLHREVRKECVEVEIQALYNVIHLLSSVSVMMIGKWRALNWNEQGVERECRFIAAEETMLSSRQRQVPEAVPSSACAFYIRSPSAVVPKMLVCGVTSVRRLVWRQQRQRNTCSLVKRMQDNISFADGRKSFWKCEKFRHSGTTLNDANCIHKYISRRLNSVNSFYLLNTNLFSLKKFGMAIHKTIVLSLLLYVWQAGFLAHGWICSKGFQGQVAQENNLARQVKNGGWKLLQNWEFLNLCSSAIHH
jgi:hypothetical protein